MRGRYVILVLLLLPPLFFTMLVYAPSSWFSVSATSWGNDAVNIATYIGDASFAISGAVLAGDRGMDLIGCILIGFVTALGGGSVRDLCLGGGSSTSPSPLGWMTSEVEPLVCLITGLTTFLAWAPLKHYFKVSSDDEWVFWTDTIGLGVFAASGAHKGDIRGATFIGSIICGMMTATFGGVVRDTLCQQPARILYAHRELYALPAIVGAMSYLLIAGRIPRDDDGDGSRVVLAILYGTWITMAFRVIAINHFVVMPTFSTDWWGDLLICCRKRHQGVQRASDDDNNASITRSVSNGTLPSLTYSLLEPGEDPRGRRRDGEG